MELLGTAEVALIEHTALLIHFATDMSSSQGGGHSAVSNVTV